MHGCMHVGMDVWMDVWTYGRIDARLYGFMDVWLYRCKYRRVDVCADGCLDVCMDVWMYVRMYVCTDGCMSVWMCGCWFGLAHGGVIYYPRLAAMSRGGVPLFARVSTSLVQHRPRNAFSRRG